MSFQTLVMERLAALTAKYNAIATNAKTIDELPVQINLDPASKIHVSRGGISESLEVQKIINAVASGSYDKLLAIGEIKLVGNLATIPANAQWKIGDTYYGNIAEIERPIPYCATGFSRKDILVANTSNDIVLVQGPETAGDIVIAPSIPIDTIFITEMDVTDATVGTPITPVITDDFVLKRESQDYLINYFDAVVEEVYLSDERASLSFIGSNTDVKSIRLSEEFMRLGKLFTFKNRQTIPITFWHNSGTGNVKLLFPNEENFVLNPNEIIQFSLNINDSSTPKLEYIGVTSSGVELPIAISDVTELASELSKRVNKVTGHSLTKNDLTDLLKAAYDNAVNWITSNGASLIGHLTRTDNPHAVTKSQVGLGSADNTSDANKPISTAQANALDLKLNITDYNNYYKGVYLTEAALIAARQTANVGDYAQVNEVGATDVVNYNWDGEENIWVKNAVAGSGATNTDQLPEGTSNLYHNTARVLATLLTGISFVTGGAIVSTDSVLVAFGKLQKQISDNLTAIGLKQNTLVSGTNIKTINGTTILGSGDIAISGGGGDMTTTTDQAVSGVKTFLSGKLGLRNVANTFTSFFTNANTASRTYTFQNKDYTVADNADLAGKMANPTGGIVNYLPKFLTANTMGLSRLWETGTFFGIGTVNSPTKDFTLGNQANREIGIEESSNTSKGRDLSIRAGRTINYTPNSNFNNLNQLIGGHGIGRGLNGDVFFRQYGGSIYKQTGGTGNFSPYGNGGGNGYAIMVATNGDIYTTANGFSTGHITMQSLGSGSFNVITTIQRNWFSLSAHISGDVYATGDSRLYKRVGGLGDFVLVSESPPGTNSVACASNGDIYITGNNKIYRQSGGSGAFVDLLQVSRSYTYISCAPNGNIYVYESNGDIYYLTVGSSVLAPLNQIISGVSGICFNSFGNAYALTTSEVFFQNNDALGTANLDGGTYKAISGTGKGTGKSRYEVWTGQKTTSGTNMQIETLREYIDENGYHVYTSMPVYSDNAAAIAGGLPIGCEYRTSTGIKMIVFQP